jgi:predicted dehydrogenase
MHFHDGSFGQIRANWSDETYRKFSIKITVYCQFGKIQVDSQELHVYYRKEPTDKSYELGWNVRWLTELSPNVGYYLRGEEYSAQIEYFINCIKNNDLENINSFKYAQKTDMTVSMIKSSANVIGIRKNQ